LGVVGRNGHGKTTLFRLIIGEEKPDSGSIIIPKNYRVGHVQQDPRFSQNTTVAECLSALPPDEQEHMWKAEKILTGLGFSTADFHQHPGRLSGGFQSRLNLAKALLSEPDLLLLDEPTNFLDITSIRWIERFLLGWRHELMIITHDRALMDRLVSHTLGIHRKKARKVMGDTAAYYNQIAQEEEVYERTRIRDERRRQEIEQFITRFRAKARLANLVQSRIKTIQKMQKKEKLQKMNDLEFSFRSHPFPGKQVLTVNRLTFGYREDQEIITNFSISIRAGDRIGIIGQNGKGKSTLLKIMAGRLQPRNGEISYHPGARTGFFAQSFIDSLVADRTVEEEIFQTQPDVGQQLARDICGAMLFPGEDAKKPISVLSGGEKSRVMLGKVLATPANCLLLDEPTNHLDMESCDALLAALDSFEGAVVIVTHNEMFLHALMQRLIVFQGEGPSVFEGPYQYFLEKIGWQSENAVGQAPAHNESNSANSGRPTKKEIRRQRAEIHAKRSKVLTPLAEQVSTLENALESLESRLEQLNADMQQASLKQDGPEIARLSKAIHDCQSGIDDLYAGLEKAVQQLDAQKAAFEKELQLLQNNLQATGG
jgi:ATP-binding cassette subfamily F protein 3